MTISRILTASLAGALILGANSLAYAHGTTFSLVPADPPLKGRVDCTDAFGGFMGLEPKNVGQVLTIVKAFNGSTLNMHDQVVFAELDNGGEFMKAVIFDLCNIGPNN